MSRYPFIGDSIAGSDRPRPIGEIWPGSLGSGYVNLVDSEPVRAMMDEYGAAAKRIAEKSP